MSVVWVATATHQLVRNTHTHTLSLQSGCLSLSGQLLRRVRAPCRETEDGETLLQDTRASLMANGTIMLSDVTYEDDGSFTCAVAHSNVSIVAHLEVFSECDTRPG